LSDAVIADVGAMVAATLPLLDDAGSVVGGYVDVYAMPASTFVMPLPFP
jgi:hypothetical protein